MNVNYSIPENSEVMSSIGVALSMIRESVERVIPSPTKEDFKKIRNEAVNNVIKNGASQDTVVLSYRI